MEQHITIRHNRKAGTIWLYCGRVVLTIPRQAGQPGSVTLASRIDFTPAALAALDALYAHPLVQERSPAPVAIQAVAAD